MWISRLELTNFRGYSHAEAEFTQGFNLIWGNNGLGKTNLVEAIYFSSVFDSHRTATSVHLIRDSQPEATVSATLNFSTRSVNQVTRMGRSAPTKVFVNGTQKRRLAEAIGTTSSVIFAPEDLDTIRRDPADRRKFIDQVVIQLQPRIAGVKADYERSLRQRNALLKSFKAAGRKAANLSLDELRSLESWDVQIIATGTELTVARVKAIDQLAPGLQHFYQQLAADNTSATMAPRLSVLDQTIDETDEISEMPQGDFDPATYATLFQSRLSALRQREIERGLTLVGPHRDDVVFGLNKLPARFGSSQGEAWSLALGSKLALAALLSDLLPSGSPILLLDDVFAVLDPDRRQRLLAHLQNYEQVIITSTNRAGLPEVSWSRSIHLIVEDAQLAQNRIVKFEIEAL